ncbi:MAG: tetratricopeptide repeat protein [Verrucomicrobia bacterium]|nr:tetratricopeptide repeat protein [Verrucomicrobiota bacterium]
MRNRFFHVVLILTLSALALHGQSSDLQILFNKGNAAYAEKQYLDAVEAYEKAFEASGQASPALLFNLGNAYYFLQDFPSALLAYERALTLEPGNPDVLANLQKITDQSGLERPLYSIAQEFAYTLPVNTWLLLLIIGSATTTLAGLLICYAPRLAPIPSLTLYLSIPLMMMAIAGLLLWKKDFSRGLILIPETGLRVAPTETANALNTLPNGTWVEVLETHEPYHYIRTPDKQEGWVKDVTVGKVWPKN